MSLAAATTSVNCTSCGAGLDVLGGGRIMVHICPYCGAELDAQDNYAVIAKFDGLKRPDSPFRIGMAGKIKGVDYTVIGMLEYTERYRGQTWRWIDHQLYSPTHGYAWLTIEDGHLVFTRRYRRPVWMSSAQVERANYPPTVTVDGDRYRYYETSEGAITFAEGEFTWAPKIGDKTTAVSVLTDNAMLAFSETNQEREVYRSELLDSATVSASFGVATPPVPQGTHPMEPYTGGDNDRFMRIVALIAMVACFALAMVFDGRTGREIGTPIEVQAGQLPASVPIEIPDIPGPVRLTLDGTPHVTPWTGAPNSNRWSRVLARLLLPDGSAAPNGPSSAHVYIGGQREGQPAGSTNHLELIFPSAQSGQYLLSLDVNADGPSANNQTPPRLTEGSITIRTHGDISNGYWLYRLAIVFLIAVIISFARKWNFNRKRWSGSDWTSED